MPDFAEPLARLIQEIKRLPGIGQKSAQRVAFHVLRSKREDVDRLVQALIDVKEKLGICSVCNNISDSEICSYCRDSSRDHSMICVLEEPHNVLPIETTRQFNGVYHVLHGAISPLRGIGPEQLRIKSLLHRIENGDVSEIILATNPTVEGEATAVLSVTASEAPRCEGDADRHGHSRRQRPRICRRGHDAEVAREPPRVVVLSHRYKKPAVAAAGSTNFAGVGVESPVIDSLSCGRVAGSAATESANRRSLSAASDAAYRCARGSAAADDCCGSSLRSGLRYARHRRTPCGRHTRGPACALSIAVVRNGPRGDLPRLLERGRKLRAHLVSLERERRTRIRSGRRLPYATRCSNSAQSCKSNQNRAIVDHRFLRPLRETRLQSGPLRLR